MDIFNVLPEELIVRILRRAWWGLGSFEYGLVCRAWLRLSAAVQTSVDVRQGAGLAEAELLQLLQRFPCCEEIRLMPESMLSLSSALLARVGRVLPGLKVLEMHEQAALKGAAIPPHTISLLAQHATQLRRFSIVPSAGLDPCGFAPPKPLIPPRPLLELPQQPATVFIYSLPSNLTPFTSLETLSIKSTFLQSLPPSIGALKALKELRLDAPLLQSFPAEIGELTSLEGLAILSTVLITLPNELTRLQSLSNLHLKCPALRSLPQGLGRLKHLRALDVTECFSLTGVEDSLAELTGLTALAVGHVNPNLTRTLNSLSTLQTLRLWSCLFFLPDAICELQHLRTLAILKCPELRALPWDLGALTSLEELHVSECPVEVLPPTFGRLKKLKVLTLRSCPRLWVNVEELRGLEALQELKIEGCKALEQNEFDLSPARGLLMEGQVLPSLLGA